MYEFFTPALDILAGISGKSDKPADFVPIDSAPDAARAPSVPLPGITKAMVGGVALPVGEVDPGECYV
jgi:hypothetical protein